MMAAQLARATPKDSSVSAGIEPGRRTYADAGFGVARGDPCGCGPRIDPLL